MPWEPRPLVTMRALEMTSALPALPPAAPLPPPPLQPPPPPPLEPPPPLLSAITPDE